MAASPDFGLETLFKLHQPITNQRDALILVIHYVLTKHDVLFVGRGTTWRDDEAEKASESLPSDWATNRSDAFRFVCRSDKRKRYTVQFTESGKTLVASIHVDGVAERVEMTFEMPAEVNESELTSSNPRLIYRNLFDLLSRIENQLVQRCGVATQPAAGPPATHATAGEAGSRRPPPDAAPEPHPAQGPAAQSSRRDPPNPLEQRVHPGGRSDVDPRGALGPDGGVPVGRRDLDPFAGIGPDGGMLFDPLRRGRDDRGPLGPSPLGPDAVTFPSGAIPPGARFDPVGPEDLFGRNFSGDPDNDMFIPPGVRGIGRPPFRGPRPGGGTGGGFGGLGGGGAGFI